MKRRKPDPFSTIFGDLTLGSLGCFVVLFVLAMKLMNPPKEEDPAVKTAGQFVVIAEWNGASHDDVDLYVRDPAGKIAYFGRKDVGLMHLEHDDLGHRSDSYRGGDGEEIEVKSNQERTVIRGIIPGEYVVVVHMFRKDDVTATPVKVSLHRVIPQMGRTLIVEKERVLEARGDEKLAFRFTLTQGSDQATDINELELEMPFTRMLGGDE